MDSYKWEEHLKAFWINILTPVEKEKKPKTKTQQDFMRKKTTIPFKNLHYKMYFSGIHN